MPIMPLCQTSYRQWIKYIAIAITLLAISTPASADFYLRSTHKEARCNNLGAWLSDIRAGVFSDLSNFSQGSEEDLTALAGAFADPLFSGAFGRDYNNLDRGHRKRIYKDLDRCFSEDAAAISWLKIPFGSRSVLRSEAGQDALLRIYRAQFEDSLKTAKGAQSNFSKSRIYKCTLENLESEYRRLGFDVEPINLEQMVAVNEKLFPLLMAQRMSSSRSAYYVKRQIDDFDYRIQSLKDGRTSAVDEDLYMQVLKEQHAALQSLMKPNNIGEQLDRYLEAIDVMVASAIDALQAIEKTPKGFSHLASFEAGWVTDYSQQCASWEPKHMTEEDFSSHAKRAQASISRYQEAVEDTLYSILTANREFYDKAIRSFDSEEDFDRFARSYINRRSAAYRALERSQHLALYTSNKETYENEIIAARKAIDDRSARLELEYAGFELGSKGGRGLVSGVEPAVYFESKPRDVVLAIVGYGVAITEHCRSSQVPGGVSYFKYTQTRTTTNSRTGQVTRSNVTDARDFAWPRDFSPIISEAINDRGVAFGGLLDVAKQQMYYVDVVRLAETKGCNSTALNNFHKNLLHVSTTTTSDWGNLTGMMNLLRGLLYGY